MSISAGDIWVVIPAFNEAAVIGDVVLEARTAYPNVIVIDDGSSDATAARARQACGHVIRHPVNLGQGAALQTGITYALKMGARYVATYDADGQHDIADVGRMAEYLLQNNLDVVLGSRFLGKAIDMSTGRRLLLRAAVVFTVVTTGMNLTDAHNGLRLFTAKAAAAIDLRQNRMAHASEILEQIARAKLNYAELGNTVRYTEYSRAKGQKASNSINILIDLFFGRLGK